MSVCDKNWKTITIRSIFRPEVTEEVQLECEFEKWGNPVFVAYELKQYGKRLEELGHTYQYRNCIHCGIRESRMV